MLPSCAMAAAIEEKKMFTVLKRQSTSFQKGECCFVVCFAACDWRMLHILDAPLLSLMAEAALLFLQARSAQESFCSDKGADLH